jgi:hypothetical protein
MRNGTSYRGFLCVLAAALLAAPGAFGAPAARVTAAVGDTSSGGQALEQRGGLEDGAGLETGDDGNCSVLLDEDALVEVCGGTSLKLERKDGRPDGPRVVNLERGDIRMQVEPRLRQERIEIHTPVAIATLLGTVVYASVDALGVATITSAASQVLVHSKSTGAEVTLQPGESVEVREGQRQLSKEKREPQAIAALGGCLVDFHGAALDSDRAESEQEELDEVVGEDIFEGDLPQVAAASEVSNAAVDDLVNDDLNDVNDVNENPPNNEVDNIVVTLIDEGVITDDQPRDLVGLVLGFVGAGGLEEVPPLGGDCGPGLPGVGENCQ